MGIFDLVAAPFTAASAQRNERRQIAELKKNQALWNALQVPSIENLQMVIHQEISQGRLKPELGQAILSNPSAMAEVGANPELVRAQEASLGALQNIAGQGGMDIQSKAKLAQVQDQLGQQERGQREAIMAQQQRRGMGSSGQGLAAQLMAQQQSANRASQAGLQTAATADQRALEALIQSGQMAGKMRGQQVGEDERRAAAADRINKFNTQHRQQLAAANRSALNNAQQFNLKADIGREQRNVAGRNYGSEQHADAYRNKYYMDANKVAGQTGANTAMADLRGEKKDRQYAATQQHLKNAKEDTDKLGKTITGIFAADGAVVPGQSYAGDRVDAQLNSGEMVLNAEQQQNLLNLLSGKTKYIDVDQPVVENTMSEDPLSVLANMNQPQKMADGGVVPPKYRETDELVKKFLRENPDQAQLPPTTLEKIVTDIMTKSGKGPVMEEPVKTTPKSAYQKAREKGMFNQPESKVVAVGDTTPQPSAYDKARETGMFDQEPSKINFVGNPQPKPSAYDNARAAGVFGPAQQPPIPTPETEEVSMGPEMAPVTSEVQGVDQTQPTQSTQPAQTQEQEKQDIIETLLGLKAGSSTGEKIAGGIGSLLGTLATTADPYAAREQAEAKAQRDSQQLMQQKSIDLRREEFAAEREEKKAEKESKRRAAEKAAKEADRLLNNPTFNEAASKMGADAKVKFGFSMVAADNLASIERLLQEGHKRIPVIKSRLKNHIDHYVNAILRKESGAAIKDEEYKKALTWVPNWDAEYWDPQLVQSMLETMHTQTVSGITPYMKIENFGRGLNESTNGRFYRNLGEDNIFRLDKKTGNYTGMISDPNDPNDNFEEAAKKAGI